MTIILKAYETMKKERSWEDLNY